MRACAHMLRMDVLVHVHVQTCACMLTCMRVHGGWVCIGGQGRNRSRIMHDGDGLRCLDSLQDRARWSCTKDQTRAQPAHFLDCNQSCKQWPSTPTSSLLRHRHQACSDTHTKLAPTPTPSLLRHPHQACSDTHIKLAPTPTPSLLRHPHQARSDTHIKLAPTPTATSRRHQLQLGASSYDPCPLPHARCLT